MTFSNIEESPLRVVHVITGLTVGGAEVMLARLVASLASGVEHSVICLASGGPIADRIRASGVRVEVLGLPAGPRALIGLPRVIRLLREMRPHVVHTWLYHADLLGGLAAKICNIPVIWGLHNSSLDAEKLGRSTARLIRVLAMLSNWLPTRIVSCSNVGLEAHQAAGYEASRLLVIQNGFDTVSFRPDAQRRDEARRAWGISQEKLVVGLVARFNPLKDHETFLTAAGLALKQVPQLRFILYGDRVSQKNDTLMRWARSAGITDACLMLGPAPNIEQQLPGFDLLVSSSSSEAFPLVLGEAMACGVPCVTTDVGDAALIVGDPARVVPAKDAHALADAIVRAVRLNPSERQQQAAAGVRSIDERFGLPRIAARFHELYLEVARLSA